MNKNQHDLEEDNDVVFIETPPKLQLASKSVRKQTKSNQNDLFLHSKSSSSENENEPCYSNFQSFRIQSDDDEQPSQKNITFKRKKIISSSSSHDCIIIEDSSDKKDTDLDVKIHGENNLLKIKPNMRVFALLDKTRHIWKPATLEEIKNDNIYVVRFDSNINKEKKKYSIREYENLEENKISTLELNYKEIRNNSKKTDTKTYNIDLDSSSVAYARTGQIEPGVADIGLKSRVVSYYTLSIMGQDNFLLYSSHLCSGSVIEVPNEENNNRYLIFFDNGYVTYAKPSDMFYVFDYLTLPVERLSFDHIYFIRGYFENYPNRIMANLDVEDEITVYSNEKWHDCRVLKLDSSLVKLEVNMSMFKTEYNSTKNFEEIDTHTLWLYRGSPRILTVYDMIMSKVAEHNDNTLKPNSFEKHIIEKQKNLIDDTERCQSILSHFFSSSKLPHCNPDKNTRETKVLSKKEIDAIMGEVVDLDLSKKISSSLCIYRQHECTQQCVNYENYFNLDNDINTFLIPLMYGWKRQVCHQPKSKIYTAKKWINYLSPCGKTLRSIQDVDTYLYITESKLTLDLFSFDSSIRIDREFKAKDKFLRINDISKGKEKIPISCVNSFDQEVPDLEDFEYSIMRKPLDESVPLNTDPNLLEGCKCEDNCRDSSKCSCWRKTFEMTLLNDSEINFNVGYIGKRVQQKVHTGIFECNSRCKCNHKCNNRVVQNGTNIRIQLFKTAYKGWGIRVLDDVPKGHFISAYCGHIMSQRHSLIRDLEFSDKYFADLDLIETLRDLNRKSFREHQYLESESDSDPELRSFQSDRLPKRNLTYINKPDEFEYICLGSDEDEQDTVGRNSPKSSCKKNTSINYFDPTFNQEERKENLIDEIKMNRYFTDKRNRFHSHLLKSSEMFIMDASFYGNVARYMNHSCSPNIFAQNVFIDTYDFRFPWIAFFAEISIKAGTELCWDYGYVVDSVEGRRLDCYCQTSKCRGRLL